jgi:DNA mismatch endonuclease (patch repair protein)
MVHGCFWHRHPRCRYAYVPKTRTTFWVEKFAANVARDRRVKADLRKLGWRVITIWECDLRRAELVSAKLLARLNSID